MSVIELADGRVRLHTYASVDAWVQGAAEGIATALRNTSPSPIDGRGVGERVSGSLLLSGGNTPAPIYAALSQFPLNWSNIGVGLVDERFLPEGDANRNDGLIRRTLLNHAAAEAAFFPLIASEGTLESSVDAANQHAQPAAVVVLGMGDDGHTASLFPGMTGLDAALAADTPYVAVDASGCPGSQTWPQRISLTPAGLASATTRILLMRGEGKRTLLERAIAGKDVHEYPVRLAWMTPGPVLDVYWCP